MSGQPSYYIILGLPEWGPPSRAQIIINAVCDYFKIHKGKLREKNRKTELVYGRQMVMVLLRKKTTMSLHEIAKTLGYKNHTTVISAVRHIDDLVETDESVRQDLKTLMELV